MALAFLITLETPLGEADEKYSKTRSGRALARESERIDFAARRCKVPAPTAFLSESREMLVEQLKADGFDPSKMRLPPEQWFSASEGLKSIRPLIEHVGQNLNDFKQPNPILKDLRAVKALLHAAEAASVRFHFTRGET